jgi:CRISPR/Cas system Type II protein with McrA/HNH and RuvC-like nuclease domain
VKERAKKRQQEYRSRPEIQERHRLNQSIRKARKQSILGTYTLGQIQDQLKRQRHKCYYCQKQLQKVKGRYIYHVEHTFPLSRVAGTDIPANSIDYIVLACPACNMSKHDKFPWEWPEGGRLC